MSVYKQAFNKLFSMAEQKSAYKDALSSVNARGRNKVVLIGIKLSGNLYEKNFLSLFGIWENQIIRPRRAFAECRKSEM